jgi:hypothetical protein
MKRNKESYVVLLRKHRITSEIGITLWEVLNDEPKRNESDSSIQLSDHDDSEMVEDENPNYNLVDYSDEVYTNRSGIRFIPYHLIPKGKEQLEIHGISYNFNYEGDGSLRRYSLSLPFDGIRTTFFMLPVHNDSLLAFRSIYALYKVGQRGCSMSVEFKDEAAVISTQDFKSFIDICLTEIQITNDPNITRFVPSVKSVFYYKEIVINIYFMLMYFIPGVKNY